MKKCKTFFETDNVHKSNAIPSVTGIIEIEGEVEIHRERDYLIISPKIQILIKET